MTRDVSFGDASSCHRGGLLEEGCPNFRRSVGTHGRVVLFHENVAKSWAKVLAFREIFRCIEEQFWKFRYFDVFAKHFAKRLLVSLVTLCCDTKNRFVINPASLHRKTYPECINGHVCWNSNSQLLFIICRPRKTNFHVPFPFTTNKLPFSLFCLQQTNRSCYSP
jgi:hypothetical protein